jgi:hypothetical protein
MKLMTNVKMAMFQLDLFEIPKDEFKKFVNSRGEGRIDVYLN